MSSSSKNSPCAACKFLRKKCTQACVLAPYFPPDEPAKFANVHKVFGATKVANILKDLSISQREDAVNSLAYEAAARLRDPVYGSAGVITALQHSLNQAHVDLSSANQIIATLTQVNRQMGGIGPSTMMPNLTQSMQPMLEEMGGIGASSMMPNLTQAQYASIQEQMGGIGASDDMMPSLTKAQYASMQGPMGGIGASDDMMPNLTQSMQPMLEEMGGIGASSMMPNLTQAQYASIQEQMGGIGASDDMMPSLTKAQYASMQGPMGGIGASDDMMPNLTQSMQPMLEEMGGIGASSMMPNLTQAQYASIQEQMGGIGASDDMMPSLTKAQYASMQGPMGEIGASDDMMPNLTPAQYASMQPLLGQKGGIGPVGTMGAARPSNMQQILGLQGSREAQQQHHLYESQLVDVSAPLASINERMQPMLGQMGEIGLFGTMGQGTPSNMQRILSHQGSREAQQQQHLYEAQLVDASAPLASVNKRMQPMLGQMGGMGLVGTMGQGTPSNMQPILSHQGSREAQQQQHLYEAQLVDASAPLASVNKRMQPMLGQMGGMRLVGTMGQGTPSNMQLILSHQGSRKARQHQHLYEAQLVDVSAPLASINEKNEGPNTRVMAELENEDAGSSNYAYP